MVARSERRAQPILLPARVTTVVVSFALALLVNFLPWRDPTLVPDFVALVLAFWCVRQPHLVGPGIGWVLGLVTDAGNGVLLGQHALAYSMLAFGALTLSRRIQWFPMTQQAMHVALLLVAAQMITIVVRMVAGADFPGWRLLAGPLVGAALWPLLTFVLLIPQRRSVEVDETRAI